MGIESLFQRGKPPTKPVVYAVAAIAAASMVAGWAGDLLLAEIVDRNPLLLILLSPRNRNLVLATNELDAATYYIVGFLRLIASDPANYLLGYWFGERALRWVKRRSKTYGPLMDDGEALFKRIGPAIVFLAPNNIVCALAGATGMKVRTFFVLNVLGTLFRLATIRRLGESLESPIGSVTDWIGEHRIWVLGFSAAALAWTIFGEFRGEDSELQTLKDLVDEQSPVDEQSSVDEQGSVDEQSSVDDSDSPAADDAPTTEFRKAEFPTTAEETE